MTTREMWLFRWTKDGAADRISKGMVQHGQDWADRVAENGATLVDFKLFSGFADWDGMYIIDFPTPQDPAQFLRGHMAARTSGAIEAAQMVRLVSPEDFDSTE